jgi:hypothetical protein
MQVYRSTVSLGYIVLPLTIHCCSFLQTSSSNDVKNAIDLFQLFKVDQLEVNWMKDYNFFSIGFYSPYYADLLPSLMDFSIHVDIW